MSQIKKRTQEVQQYDEIFTIDSNFDTEPPAPKIVRICWNTGEEKNCAACYLRKGCKAKD